MVKASSRRHSSLLYALTTFLSNKDPLLSPDFLTPYPVANGLSYMPFLFSFFRVFFLFLSDRCWSSTMGSVVSTWKGLSHFKISSSWPPPCRWREKRADQQGKVNSGTTWLHRPSAVNGPWTFYLSRTPGQSSRLGWTDTASWEVPELQSREYVLPYCSPHSARPLHPQLNTGPATFTAWTSSPFLPTVVNPALREGLTMAPRTGRGPEALESPGPAQTSPPHSAAGIHSTPRGRRSSGSAGSSSCAGQEVPPISWTPATPRHAEVRIRRTSSIAISVGARIEAGGGTDLESEWGRRRRSTGRWAGGRCATVASARILEVGWVGWARALPHPGKAVQVGAWLGADPDPEDIEREETTGALLLRQCSDFFSPATLFLFSPSHFSGYPWRLSGSPQTCSSVVSAPCFKGSSGSTLPQGSGIWSWEVSSLFTDISWNQKDIYLELRNREENSACLIHAIEDGFLLA